MFPMFSSVNREGRPTSSRTIRRWRGWWWFSVVWLASATALAQQPPPAGGEGAEAPPPSQNPAPPPSQNPAPRSPGEDLAAAVSQAAQQQQADREHAELQANIAALRAELDAERATRLREEAELRAQVETLSATAAQAPPAVASARYGLSLTGFDQNDLTFRQSAQDQLGPSGAPLNEDRFVIRRARVKAVVDRYWVAGAIEFDGNTVNGPTARILDVEASLKVPPARSDQLPLFMFTIGGFKIPFGFEIGQSDRDRLFLERSLSERALFPGEYDLGARVLGGWRTLRWMGAVMNGEPVGERGGFPYRDPNRAKDYVGRFGFDTPIAGTIWIAGGVSGLWGTGFHPGTPATKPTLQWVDRNADGALQSNEITVIPGTAAVPSQNFSRWAYGNDLRIGGVIPGVGATVFSTELYFASNLDRAILPADPIAFGRSYREHGYYFAITQDLGSHAAAGFRYDFYDPDSDSINQVMGASLPAALSYETWSLTAALKAPSGRLIAEFDVNRNHNGRDLQGNPTNLRDNAFTIRGEVSF